MLWILASRLGDSVYGPLAFLIIWAFVQERPYLDPQTTLCLSRRMEGSGIVAIFLDSPPCF